MAIGNRVPPGSTTVDIADYDAICEELASLQRAVIRTAEELAMSAATRQHLRSLVFRRTDDSTDPRSVTK